MDGEAYYLRQSLHQTSENVRGTLFRRGATMRDFFTGLCFVAIIIVPTIIATRALKKHK